MWAHVVYLLVIPLAGMVALGEITKDTGVAGLGGWIVATVYLAAHAKFYRLPRRLLAGVLTVSIIPAQVLAHMFLFGGGIAEYWVEEAFVELATLSLALAAVMLAYRPSGWSGAAVGVGIALIAVIGFGRPLAESYVAHGVGPEVWVLLAVVLGSGTWAHIRLVAPAARLQLHESVPEAQPGLVERAIDWVAPSTGDAVQLNIPENAVAALIIVQCVLWLAVAVAHKL